MTRYMLRGRNRYLRMAHHDATRADGSTYSRKLYAVLDTVKPAWVMADAPHIRIGRRDEYSARLGRLWVAAGRVRPPRPAWPVRRPPERTVPSRRRWDAFSVAFAFCRTARWAAMLLPQSIRAVAQGRAEWLPEHRP